MKRKVEYEVRLKTKNQKIFLKEYANPEETVVSWSNGKEKEIFKGEEGVWRASDFIKVRWPDRKVLWTSTETLSPEEVKAQEKKWK